MRGVVKPNLIQTLIVAGIALGELTTVYAIDLGTLGAIADGLSKGMDKRQQMEAQKEELRIERERNALEQQRIELEKQRQQKLYELEQQKFREEAAAVEQRRLAELEAERRAEQARVDAYKRGTTGSGFFVSKNGHIVTNAHVLGDYQFAIAKDSTGKIYELDVIAIDKQNDLALLQAAKKTEGLTIMPGQSVGKGLRVYAIGYPQPGIQGTESKITDGIISSMTGLRNDNDSYQISVPIQAGNSGGPLVTESGAVVGVIVATVNARKFFSITGDIPQNVNFAIKPDILEGFLKSNKITPLRPGKAKLNPLGTADENTVMIAARPERFDLPSVPTPSGRLPTAELPKLETPISITQNIALTPELIGNEQNKIEKQNSDGRIRCQVGYSTPVRTTKEKCLLVKGNEVQ